MSYKYSFADNGVYSAADVNEITKRLVTSGIEDPFTDGVPYNLSAFNDVGTLLYTSGVVPETVLTLKVIENDENTVTILPGTAFFEDGAVIEIEAGGHTLSKIPDAVNYVYLKNDLVNANACFPVCSVDAPTGIFVPLAEISEDGTVTDKRTYAKGKLPGYASNTDYMLEINDRVGSNYQHTTIQRTYDIGNNKYKYLLLVSQKRNIYDDTTYDSASLGIYFIEDKRYLSFTNGGRGSSYVEFEKLLISREGGEAWIDATVSEISTKLTLNINTYSLNNASASFTIYLF